ncbi:sigma-70 family RNA polymerase sigma factor [Amycolatopsis sp. NPDC051106]|uniref:RNA polymerase sigma factor n=1 Tax=unclassified Amycolatopsis TaxID=2618356 RepID=UPI00344A87C8
MINVVSAGDVQTLVDLAKAGVPEAGPYLVSLCGARLTHYASLIAPDLSAADREKVCEKAVELAVERITKFDGSRASFESWLRGFVRNVLRTQYRAGREIPTDPLEMPEPRSEAGRPATQDSLNRRINDLVTNLSQTDQLIIQLRHYEALTYDVIAELLEVNPTACRQRHARAIGRLRHLIQSDSELAILLQGGASNE